MKQRFAIIAIAGVLLLCTAPNGAYSRSGQRWPAGNVTMHLQQGASSSALIDGSRDWNAVTESALGIWNPFLSGLSFRIVAGSSAGVASRNGVNNVAWADDVFGDPFGDAVAVTYYLYRGDTMVEADVLFDRGRNWNSYRGNTRSASGATLYDLRRVALHEFGHVLGLDHPDQNGQSVTAIMNSRVSNVDSLQTDDTNGARAIYGATAAPAPTPAPAPSANRSPTVTASCSPCTIESGQLSTLRASASDPDGDALTYQWTVNQGTLASTTGASTFWTAPLQPASLSATVTVQDSRGGRATATVTLSVVFRHRLFSGARLLSGHQLVSANGRYRLSYQTDGNLVLYDDVERTAPWTSKTVGTSPGYAMMQNDGNFVIYDAQTRDQFVTGSIGNPNAHLQVNDDGNLVVYRSNGEPAWHRLQ